MLRALLLVVCLVPFCAGEEEPGEFSIRPAFPLAAPYLTRLRALVRDDPEAAALGAQVVAVAEPLVTKEPTPLAVIRYEGLVNTHPERLATVERLRSMDDVAALVQRWQVADDAGAAAALLRHLDAWSATYQPTGNDVNENKLSPLLVGWHSLRAQAPAELRTRIDAWIADIGQRHVSAVAQSKHFSNRYTKHVRLAMYCGLAIDRAEWVHLGRAGIERFVENSLRADGTSLDLELRDTLTYHCSALVPALEMALLLGAEGRALYVWRGPRGGSLKSSVDYVVPFATGEKTRKEWVNSKVELDRKRAAAGLEKYRIGREFEPVQAKQLMEAASAFDSTFVPIWNRLAGSSAQRFGSWSLLAQAAIDDGR